MAANMIGVKKNIIIVNMRFIDVVMFNPVIISKSGLYETEEGCLSLEGVRKTSRQQEIEVEYYDFNWKKQRQKLSGWTAQICQHEIDHLLGKIIQSTLQMGENDMQIFVDADACPVVGIVEKIAKEYKVPVTLLCDINHVLSSNYSEVIVVGAGADAVDYKLISICHKGDIVVSQDYGVAAMALGKGAFAIHQSGRWYTNDNIDQMLMERHLNKKARRSSSKNHIKGPRKRTAEDDERFRQSFEKLLYKALECQSYCVEWKKIHNNSFSYAGRFIGHHFSYNQKYQKEFFLLRCFGNELEESRWLVMKGFHTDNGFMGYVDGEYVLFASESDYYDYMD